MSLYQIHVGLVCLCRINKEIVYVRQIQHANRKYYRISEISFKYFYCRYD